MPTTRPSGLIVPDGTDNADLDGVIFPDLAESIEDNYKLVLTHGATAGTARPADYDGPIEWRGTVVPTNAANGDEYLNTTTGERQLKVAGAFIATYQTKASLDTKRLGAAAMGGVQNSPSLSVIGYDPVWLLDAATQEGAGGAIELPSDWATVNVFAWWENAGAGAGDVVLFGADVAWTDGGTSTGTNGAGVTATAAAQNVPKRTQLLTGISTTNRKAWAVYRSAANAGDTLANDIAVLALEIVKAS
jgi:hypothetical protein